MKMADAIHGKPLMRFITSGLIFAILALVLYVSWSPEGSHSNPVEQQLEKEKPIILQKPILSDFEGSRLKMKIHAKTARIFENEKVTLLTNIDGKFYSDNKDSGTTRVIANSGSIKGNDQLITVWGNVNVYFSDGQKLHTEKLNLDQKREQLYNKVAVTVVSGTDEIQASRMNYNMKTGVLVLTQPKAWIESGEF